MAAAAAAAVPAAAAGLAATLVRPSARLCCCSCSSSRSSRASLHAQASAAAAGGRPTRSWKTMRETAEATSPAAAAAAAPAAAANKGREGTAATAAAVRLRRAGTLLLNDPPPSYEVSVHRGLKVQASLLLQRLPLVYREPHHEQQFRVYKEEWEQQTSNGPLLGEEIVFMQLPGQFLETQQQQQQREQQQRKTGDAELSELDMLLQQQGLKLTTRRRSREQQEQQQQQKETAAAAAAAGGREDQSLSRLPERPLLLLVKYGDLWQLPVEDRRAGQTMRQTLARLCMQQLGLRGAPFMVGFSPAAVRRIRNKVEDPLIQGRELFFYRAYYVPGRPQVSPPLHSPISDWAWLSADEAKTRMAPAAFAAVRDALLLG